MGKASRWFRGLLGLNRLDSNPNSNLKRIPSTKLPNEKCRWGFIKPYRQKCSNSRRQASSYDAATPSSTIHVDVNNHVNGGDHGSCVESREVWAAVIIQSCFRGYLAKRALRALKGLVKLQALVRGHIVRTKAAETMRCMQAMLRAQARARSVRAYISEPLSKHKSCQLHQPGALMPQKCEQFVRAKSAKQDRAPEIERNGSRSSNRVKFSSSWSDSRMGEPTFNPRDRANQILEIDTGRPHLKSRRQTLLESSHSELLPSDHVSNSCTTSKNSTTHHTIPSSYCTAENCPQLNSATSLVSSSRRGPFNHIKGDGLRSFLSGYSDCPRYMAYTESSRAKLRSLSAPKQRPLYNLSTSSSSNKRYWVHGLSTQTVSTLQAGFSSKAYPGSGRVDRLGMTAKDSTVVYYSGYLN